MREVAGMGVVVEQVEIMEVCSLGRLREFASLFGLWHGHLSGEIWQRKCSQIVKCEKPLFVLGSPKYRSLRLQARCQHMKTA